MNKQKQRQREALAVELAGQAYTVLSRHMSHGTTLGELVVLTEIAKGVYCDKPVTVSEIAKITGLSRWVVSRIVLRYIEAGSIKEIKDPEDSRKNRIIWTDLARNQSKSWSDDWLRLWEKSSLLFKS